MDIFNQALNAAKRLLEENENQIHLLNAQRELNSSLLGENSQLKAELESVKIALTKAQGQAGDRKAMIAELTAQLGTLGKFFIHGSDEITKLVKAVKDVGLIEPESQVFTVSSSEVELVGPYIGKDIEPHHIPREGDTNIPFAPRTKLLSETAIQVPAFLQKTGGTKEMTFLERRRFLKNQRK
jgi:hypothetical protein